MVVEGCVANTATTREGWMMMMLDQRQGGEVSEVRWASNKEPDNRSTYLKCS